jgi:hypothetical protein
LLTAARFCELYRFSLPQYETVTRALAALPSRGSDLHIVPQNLYELWVVATRPVAQNGLGLSIPEATSELMRLKSMFPLLPDTPAIYPVWENLVIQYRVSGKPAHDARLVAAMQVHGLIAILTFDRIFPLCRHRSRASRARRSERVLKYLQYVKHC